MTEPSVVVEATRNGFSAYSPDTPGCIATGRTEEEARDRMAVALRLHRRALEERSA